MIVDGISSKKATKQSGKLEQKEANNLFFKNQTELVITKKERKEKKLGKKKKKIGMKEEEDGPFEHVPISFGTEDLAELIHHSRKGKYVK